jgi:pimeloyl-ACP methyl ester carboxylesterase
MQSLSLRRSGRGRPIVFLGGCPTTWDVLSPLAKALTTTHETIELALPGYGQSPALAEPYSLEAAHEAVEATLRGAGVTSCAIVGFSGGAYRALALACRGNVEVTQVLSLGGLASLEPAEKAGFHQFAAALRAGQDLRPLAGPRFLSPAFATAHPEAVKAVEAWLEAAPKDVIAGELDAFADADDLGPRLSQLAIPVLARVGELDQATPPPKSEAIVKACKNARLEVVPGAGHALVLEDLDGVVGAARRLFA